MDREMGIGQIKIFEIFDYELFHYGRTVRHTLQKKREEKSTEYLENVQM